jgi:hypothetical protein
MSLDDDEESESLRRGSMSGGNDDLRRADRSEGNSVIGKEDFRLGMTRSDKPVLSGSRGSNVSAPSSSITDIRR